MGKEKIPEIQNGSNHNKNKDLSALLIKAARSGQTEAAQSDFSTLHMASLHMASLQ